MPRHEDPDLRLIASLVALNGVLSKEGAGYSRAAQDALQHADDLVALLGEKPAAGYSEERIQRFKDAAFSAVRATIPSVYAETAIEQWRRAWEATA